MQWLRSIPVHYPKSTLFIGVILLLLAGWYGVGVFPKLTSDDNSFNALNSESATVAETIKKDFNTSGNSSLILFSAKHGSEINSPSVRHEVERLLAKLKPKTLTSYYTTGAPSLVSTDNSKTYAIVTLEGNNSEQSQKLLDFVEHTTSDVVSVNVGGMVVGEYESVMQTRHDLEKAELISLPIVALLLLFFFRSIVASAIPLIMAVLTICGALALARFTQHFTTIDTYTINVITILGLGLSVDYSLLAVNRFREELKLGLHRRHAAIATAHTAGRTIMFSAITVIMCLLSLLVFPVGFMHSIAIGGAAAVIIAMLVSSVLIPALFSLLGHNIDRWRLPLPTSKHPGRAWRRVAKFGVSYPWVTLGIGSILIIAFAIPLMEVKSSAFTYKVMPNNSHAYTVGKIIDEEFTTKTPSVTVLAAYDSTPSRVDLCRTAESLARINHVDSLSGPYAPTRSLSCEQIGQLDTMHALPVALTEASDTLVKHSIARFDITPVDDMTSPSTIQLIKDIRMRHDAGVTYRVGGSAALGQDALDSYGANLPYALAVIVITMLLVLTFTLGSVVIPLQAVIINSLALVIAVGSLVLMYQFGWFTSLFNQTVLGGLNPSMPILVCTIAFGLSMDYAVFLYSRMHEIYDKTKNPETAILEGVEKTGPIITAAALVFFAVVAAFAMSKISMMQQIGFGLAIAVLVDAFVVRILFVPAIMRLFGRTSWFAPEWIKRRVIVHE